VPGECSWAYEDRYKSVLLSIRELFINIVDAFHVNLVRPACLLLHFISEILKKVLSFWPLARLLLLEDEIWPRGPRAW
jgi:hypothetical protein